MRNLTERRNNNSKRQEGVRRINKNLIFRRFINKKARGSIGFLDCSLRSIVLLLVPSLPRRENKRNNEEKEVEEEEEEEGISRYYSASTPPTNRRRKRRRRGAGGKGSIQGDRRSIKRREGKGDSCLIAVTLLENLAEVPFNFEWRCLTADSMATVNHTTP